MPVATVAGRQADLELMQRAAAGVALAQREVVQRLLLRCRATARYWCRDDAEADDLAQLALCEVLRSAAGFRGESRLERWADCIVLRSVRLGVRRRRQTEQRFAPTAEPDAIADGGPDDDVMLRLARRRLAEHLGRLDEVRREAITMKLVLGHSVEDIARATGVSVNTVKDRLKTARRKLRKWLARDAALRDFVTDRTP